MNEGGSAKIKIKAHCSFSIKFGTLPLSDRYCENIEIKIWYPKELRAKDGTNVKIQGSLPDLDQICSVNL